MATEYRIVRRFDLERDGIGGTDAVWLGRVAEEYARRQLREHQRFAKTVTLQTREVGEWRDLGPTSDEGSTE